MKQQIIKHRRDALASPEVGQLRDQVIEAARRIGRSRSAAANEAPSLKDAARRCAGSVGMKLDAFWKASQGAPEGPIDVIDMFSGCGGMSSGFRAVNGLVPAFRLAMAIDVDRVANASYARNLGLTPREVDVSALAEDESELKRLIQSSRRREGNPLVLIGCAPCQGFSSHRNRAGASDGRNSLFVDFAKIASVLKPDAVVVENVPELLTNKYWSFVEEARTILQASGYTVYLGVHNMAEFGVPQERFRAVMLALPRRFTPPRPILPAAKFRTVRQVIGGLRAIEAGEHDRTDEMHYSAGHQPSTIETIRAVPADGGNRPRNVGPPCLRRAEERQGKAVYEDVYGRLFWDRPAITITAYARNPASGRFVHPEQDRGLSVREASLLQGFPSEYWFAGSLDERFRQIGNAVPPIFSSYLAAYLLGEILGSPEPDVTMEPGISKPIGLSFSRMIPGLKAKNRQGNASSSEALNRQN